MAATVPNHCGAEAPKSPWLGAFVVAKDPNVALRVGQSVIEAGVWGRKLQVRRVRGPWLWMGRGWLRQSEVVTCDEAIGYFSARIAERPSAFAFVSRGSAECHLQNYESALADFNDAIRLDPREYRAYRERAECFGAKKMRTEEIRDCNSAIELCPTDASAYVNRALAWTYRNLDIDSDDRRRALDDLARAIELAPRDGRPYGVRAQVFEECGELETGLHDASEAIGLDPFLPEWYTLRARILYALDRRAEGRADFDRAERLDPTSWSKECRQFCEEVLFPSEEQKRVQAARPWAEFPIAKGPNAVILPVVINGAQYHFLVDTASTYCVFHARHRELLGESLVSLNTATATGESRLSLYLTPLMTLGNAADEKHGIMLAPMGAFCVDLRVTETLEDTRIDGILGSDVLKHIVLSIDFDRGMASVSAAADPNCGQAVALVWHKRRLYEEGPFVLAELNHGAPQEFLVDFGHLAFGSGSLTAEVFDREAQEARLFSMGPPLVTMGLDERELLETRVARARGLSLAGFEHGGLAFSRGKFNLLGVSYFSRYAVTLDLRNNVMYLRPGKGFRRLDPVDRCGLLLVRTESGVKVVSVEAGSPAELAGCERGDLVEQIEGATAPDIRLPDAMRILSSPGEHVLVVRRPGRTSALTVKIGENKEDPPTDLRAKATAATQKK